MPNRVYWRPASNPTVASYRVLAAPSAAAIATDLAGQPAALAQLTFVPGSPQLLATVPADPSGPAFDAASGRYFYDDAQGTAASVYQVQGLGAAGLVVADTGLFQPVQARAATDVAARTRVDHNYGGVDALRYLSPGGAPIPGATVRAWNAADYNAGRTDLALASTQTDVDGRWVAPFFLAPASYVLVFESYGVYGPDRVDLVVG